MKADMVNLGSIAELRNGINYNKDNFGKGVKVVNVADFKDYFKPKYEELGEINPEGIVNKDSLLQKGDILFVRSNGNKELIGRTLFIDENYEDITYSAFCIRARFIDENIEPKFYVYLFKTNFIRNTLTAQGNGTNISNLNQGILNKLQVPKPEISVQKKVVDFLSKYDDLIENNLKRIKLLEETADLIYKEWFVNFRFPGYEKCEFVNEIPQGWDKKIFNKICNVRNGYAFKSKDYSKEGISLIRTRDFSESVFIDIKEDIRIQNNMLEQYEKYLLNEYEFLLIMVGASIGKYGIVLKKDLPSLQNQNMWAIYSKDNEEVPQTYIIEFMKDFVRTLMSYRTGAARDFFRKSHLEERDILIPKKNILKQFDKLVKPLFEQINLLLYENEKLKEARDILIPKLIMGEIEI